MTISIRNGEAEQLAREMARRSNMSITDVVLKALREFEGREQNRQENFSDLADRLLDIGAHCAGLPEVDGRSAEEIIGYDEHGLPS